MSSGTLRTVIISVLAGCIVGAGIFFGGKQIAENTAAAAANTQASKVSLKVAVVSREASHSACVSANQVRKAITVILLRSRQTLPKNPYYKMHPDLLPAALAENEFAIQQLRGLPC